MLKMSTYAKLYHIAATGFCFYTIYNLHIGLHIEVKDSLLLDNFKRFSFRFLTNWTFTLQTLYFSTCMMSYFLSLFASMKNMREKLDFLRNYMVTTIVTPGCFVVTLFFWSIYSIDRELVYPKAIDSILPVWINHSIHTINSVMAIGDLVLVNHKYPPWRNIVISVLCYFVAYGVCLFGTYFETGIWLYPFFKYLTWTLRVVVAIAVFALALFMAGFSKLISQTVWGSSGPSKIKKGSKPKHKRK